MTHKEERRRNGSGRIALVTGAGTGIGKRTALLLLEAGYCVVLSGRRVELLEQTVLYIANLPLDVNVPFMTVMATGMPFIGRG